MSRFVLSLGVAVLIATSGIPWVPKSLATPNLPPSPAQFSPRVDNLWFSLRRGTTYVYRGVKDGQPSRDVFTVTRATKTILGVRCTVVSDKLYLRGLLAERTHDWYAQDKTGNVWYFGEATAELTRGGKVESTEGSWQTGVDAARAGIFMPAQPRPSSPA